MLEVSEGQLLSVEDAKEEYLRIKTLLTTGKSNGLPPCLSDIFIPNRQESKKKL